MNIANSVTEQLTPGLPREELVERLHFHQRRGELAERAVGFYLLDMQRRGLFRPGFRSAAQWAAEQLGIRRADRLLGMAKRLEGLPAIDRAFSRGEVSWTKVREISLVAVEETEQEWLALARTKSSRHIERAVARAKRGDRPGEGLGTPRLHRVVRIPLSAEEHVRWETAVRKLRDGLGKGATPRDALMSMVDATLRADPEGPGGRERGDSFYTVVYHVGPDGKSAWMDTEDGRLEVDPETIREKVRSGAKTIEAQDLQRKGEPEQGEVSSAIRFGERGRAPKDEREAPVPPELRGAVLARDSYRCVVCGSTRNLAVHHLDSRAHGGKGTMGRLVSLCDPCHSLCHEGEMELRVDEEGNVTALGKDGKPLAQQQSAAEVLGEGPCALETLEVPERAPPTPDPPRPVSLSSALSVEELPAELSAEQWKELEGRLEWSPSQHAFLLGPEGDVGPSNPEPPSEGTKAHKRPSARPRSFAEFVGQRRVVGNLLLASQAAEARGEPLGHVLLHGPAGLGKTTLARLLAAERGATLQEVVGAHLEDPHQLLSLLAHMEKDGFLFIDEIHAIGRACQEALYSALEDGLVDLVVRDRVRARLIRVRLKPFTLVGATTRLGALSEPFRARFKLRETLEPYGEKELSEVVTRAAKRLGADVSAEAALAVARRSRGTPREAIRLLERARDVAQVSAMGSGNFHHVGQVSDLSHVVQMIEMSHVVHGAARLGIDERGLSREDRAVVRLLIERGRPVGLEAIASRLGLDLDTLRDVHEPWLGRAGLVERTERGRVATAKARKWYGKPNPGGSSDSGEDSGGPSPRPGPQGGPPRWGIPVLRLRLHSA